MKRTRLAVVTAAVSWLAFLLGGLHAGVCRVSHTTAFLAAFANTSCNSILVTGGGFALQLAAADAYLRQFPATSYRVPVMRELTLRGEHPYTVLDCAFLKRRVALEENATLTIENLFLTNIRQPSATSASSLDILSLGTYNTVVFRSVVLHYKLCVPPAVTVRYGPAVQRPLSVQPGSQIIRLVPNFCVPGLDPHYTPSCWNDSISMQDYGITGSTLDPQGVRVNQGSVLNLNSTFVCEFTFPLDCVGAKGLPTCVGEAVLEHKLSEWDTYDLLPQHPPADEGGGGGGDGPRVLTIVLPCVLGGVGLLAALVGVGMWWRGRQLRKPPHQDTKPGSSQCLNGSSKGKRGVLVWIPRTPSTSLGLAFDRVLDTGNSAAAGPMGQATCTPRSGVGTVSEVWPHTKAGGVSPVATVQQSAGVHRLLGSSGAAGGGGFSGASAYPPSGHTFFPGSSYPYSGPQPLAGPSCSISQPSISSLSTAAGHMAGPGGGGGAGATALRAESVLGNPLLGPGTSGSGGSGCCAVQVPLDMVLGRELVASRDAVVGRGTFATVLKGDMGGRPVAVKLFHRDAVGGNADDVKSLQQEIAILARCQHPNVVALLGAGSTVGGEEVFLVEELMVQNLQRACHEGDGLPLARVLAVARDIAMGLAYLHPTVIHRDLKPANVLLDAAGTAKLTDFGLSRLWGSTVHTANPEAGTVQYMAPECFSGSLSPDPGKSPITHLSDIYSFGVLLWQMLTNERPWKGLSSIQVALAVGYEGQRLKLPTEGESAERFHPKLRKLVVQCFDTDPRKRPGAAEIAKRLSLMLQNLEAHGSLSNPQPGVTTHGGLALPQRSQPGALSSAGEVVVTMAPISSCSLDTEQQGSSGKG